MNRELSDYEEHVSFISEQFRPMELAEICCKLTMDHSKEVERLNEQISQLTHQITRKNETIECLLRSEEEYFTLTKELNDQIQYYKDRLEAMIEEKFNQSTTSIDVQTDPSWKVKIPSIQPEPKIITKTRKWLPLMVFLIMLTVKLVLSCSTKSSRNIGTNTDPTTRQKSVKHKLSRKIKVN